MAKDTIKFVLSQTAVRRLRRADELMEALYGNLRTQAPAAITNDIAEAWLALTEACNEIDRCNVESAA